MGFLRRLIVDAIDDFFEGYRAAISEPNAVEGRRNYLHSHGNDRTDFKPTLSKHYRALRCEIMMFRNFGSKTRSVQSGRRLGIRLKVTSRPLANGG